MNTSNDWPVLIQRFLDGVASPVEVATLSDQIESDAETRLLYLKLARVHAALASDVGFDEPPSNPQAKSIPNDPQNDFMAISGLDRSANRSRLASSRLPLALAATIAVLIAGVTLAVTQRDSTIVRITELRGSAQWTGDGGQVSLDLTAGQRLHGGTLELMSADSWAAFEFRDGSTVNVSGPSILTISERDQKTLHLRSGRLSASVKPQRVGRPMLIHTPTADVEVVGTQFNLGAGPSSTALSVNEGKVRVTRLADGSVAEVAADHQVVASASRQDDFRVARRQHSVNQWQSSLPTGIAYGEWNARSERLKATPLLWRGCERNNQQPILLYVASLSVSRGERPPVELHAGSRFRIRGRMDSPKDLLIGLTTQHLKGGFAGKHHAFRKAHSITGAEGEFDFEVPIEEFTPEEPDHPKSPIGLGLYDCWYLTFNEDAGLEITSVELIPSDLLSNDASF